MFLSGAYCSDGDSYAFPVIFESTSTNGRDWTTPQTAIATDYNVRGVGGAGSQPDESIGISAYCSGRVYSPAVVNGQGE